jgi:hypothetical protein
MENKITLKEFIDIINSITSLNSKSHKIIMHNRGKVLKTFQLSQIDHYLQIMQNPEAQMEIQDDKELYEISAKFLKDLKLASYTFALTPKSLRKNICFIVEGGQMSQVITWAEDINAEVLVTQHNKGTTYKIIDTLDSTSERNEYFIIFDSLESMLGH